MKQNLFYILFTLTSVISYGQVSLSLKPDKSDYNAKELVNLTLTLELNGSDLDQQSPLQLPDLSKFHTVGSGSVTNTFVDPETNTVVIQKVTRLAIEPKLKGKIKIGSVLVTINNKIYKTEPFNIFIRDVEKKPIASNLSNDVFLNMEIDDREIYKHQATYAVLRVYSKNIDNLRKVKNLHLPEQENINVHLVSIKKSEIDPSGYSNMPSQILAVFMVFPNEAGWVEVPSVSASVNTYSSKNNILSNKVKLNVKKLPEDSPESFKNAVGDFKVEVYNASKEKVEEKKPLNIIVKVSGEGNLSHLILPKVVKSSDYEIFAPKITTLVTPGKEGVKGEILANYLIIPNKTGVINVKTEEFSFFNPNLKEYVNAGQEELKLNSFSHEQVLEARSTVEKVNEYTNDLLETVDSPVLKTTSFKVKEKNKLNWNVLFLNSAILLGLILLGLWFRNLRKKQLLVKEIATKKPLGSVAETEKEIRNSLKTDISDYFVYLEKLNINENFNKFFDTIDELDSEVKSQYFQSSDKAFTDVIEDYKGKKIAEDYKNLQQKIQIERYSPIKNVSNNKELLKEIIKLYSQISK